jgi:MFS family permease
VTSRSRHTGSQGQLLGSIGAVVLVFTTSAAVLVLEILAGRLLAPYVGVSLETYTGIIGTVLAAIAAGTALGGRLADRVDPRRLLGPALILGGILAWLALPLLTWLGPRSGDGPVAIVFLAAFAFFLPAAVLSGASPMVAKLRLDSLEHTGSVVGGLSAAGTAGALFGTFVTGFILVAAMPTKPIVVAVGASLIVGGLGLWWRFATTMPSRPAASLLVVAVAGSLGLAATDPSACRWETAYFCATVEHDPLRPSGRILRLDTLRHSYVDLVDPTYLDFRYIRLFASVAESLGDGPIETLHVGGGGFTFPRYLAATRPGGSNVVIEIDDELVEIAQDHLGLDPSGDIELLVNDARQVVRRQPAARFDLVVGDAFGGLSPPVAPHDRRVHHRHRAGPRPSRYLHAQRDRRRARAFRQGADRHLARGLRARVGGPASVLHLGPCQPRARGVERAARRVDGPTERGDGPSGFRGHRIRRWRSFPHRRLRPRRSAHHPSVRRSRPSMAGTGSLPSQV